MKRIILSLSAFFATLTLSAQPRYDKPSMNLEKLNRGVVALRSHDNKVVVSWRTLEADAKGESYDVYRNGEKLNAQPLTTGGTFFIDDNPLSTDAVYTVKGGCAGEGSYTLKADSPQDYIPIPLDKPADRTLPNGQTYTYSANDASVGDVDGDGQYEIILKWEPSRAHDNSHNGFTGNTLFDCYRLDGTKLWRIDMGCNIRSGAHYVPFLVYDFDGDGKAEFMVKTADGTTDGKGHVIGDPKAVWLEGIGEERSPLEGRILRGPEYLTVFSGLTGEALATVDYVPDRGQPMEWGDSKGNRSERYLAAVAYLDGKRASAVFCRGYYTRTVLAAWNWDGHSLTNYWTFDTKNTQWSDYAGQGNHNIRVADVDGDGCDEITYGSMAVDNDGRGLYNTRMGHGDAMHLTAFDPSTDKLQLWDCHENKRDGSELRDAATGEVIFQIKSSWDVGRCMAADIDPTNPGLEMWSSDSKGIRNIKGKVLIKGDSPTGDKRKKPARDLSQKPARDQHQKPNEDPRQKSINASNRKPGKDIKQRFARNNGDNTAMYMRGRRLPTNSAVWWDGDLLREMLDHETVSKYDWTTGTCNPLYRFEGCTFNNGTKSNPCLSADIIGDWREEVLVRTKDSSELRLYVSTIPTDYRIDCLMQDIPYRLAIAYQNVAYNQPPHTGYYLGPDKTDYLK